MFGRFDVDCCTRLLSGQYEYEGAWQAFGPKPLTGDRRGGDAIAPRHHALRLLKWWCDRNILCTGVVHTYWVMTVPFMLFTRC